MNIFHSFVLGIVEGITEFLPVSSTGHLILTSKWMGLAQTDFLSSFTIAIQLGAIFAVIMLYGKSLICDVVLMKKVAAAFIPTAIIGLFLYKFIKHVLLGSSLVVVCALFVGGVIIILFEKFHQPDEGALQDLKQLSYRQAVLIGVFQSLAVIPGVSRSAATIIGGLSLGLSRRSIVEFSFLLAIPTMAAATALDLIKSGGGFTSAQFGLLAMGVLVSFIVAVLAIKVFLKFIQKHSFVVFGVYRMLIAVCFYLMIH
ncbi:undecaprenyl-diphosphatase UppP [Candidatus Omnitrophota bacterium]